MSGTALRYRPDWQDNLVLRQMREVADRQEKLDAGEAIYYVWRCPKCLRQHRGPGGHPMAGDRLCQGIGPDGKFHTANLERIAVVPS